jgi:6-phosphogluconate dehydrogenase
MVYGGDKDSLVDNIAQALCVAMIITYSQGFSLLARASEAYKYGFNLENIAAIWQGGCIIRSCILENIVAAYKVRSNLPHLLADRNLGQAVVRHQNSLRLVVQTAAQSGIPAMGMMNALSYFDAIRSSWLPANLIQAQRDYFGSHTYERIDAKGTFHTQWSQD